jgi:hypothetical protein
VAEALTSSVSGYISSTRSFKEWELGSGTSEQLKFTADYLGKDLAALEKQMGLSGVTVDNYLSMYDEAIKKSFTPETISTWKNLGDALISATDANRKYTDSLKSLTASTVKPNDMMLSKFSNVASTDGVAINNQLLVQIVKTLKSIRDNALYNTSSEGVIF